MSRISFLFFVFFLGITLLLFPVLPGPLATRLANAASVTLAWDPNTEPDIAGYKLYYGKTSGKYESVIDVGNQTTYAISDLEDGKTYYFVVRAYNIFGKESDFSSELRYPDPFSVAISLSAGMNLISLPLEPINSSISILTEQLSPCLLQVLTYVKDAEGYDTWYYYDPSELGQSTLTAMDPGKGYWIEMSCPGEMMVVGNRTINSIPLPVGENLVGYNSLSPLPVSHALASIAGKYTLVWTYKDEQWIFYNPSDEGGVGTLLGI